MHKRGWMLLAVLSLAGMAQAQVLPGYFRLHTLDNGMRIQTEARLVDVTNLQLQALNAQLRQPGRIGVVLNAEVVDFPPLADVQAVFDVPNGGRPLLESTRCPDGRSLQIQHTWERVPERVTDHTLWIHHVLRYEGRPVEHQFVHLAGAEWWLTVGETRCTARRCTLPTAAELGRLYCPMLAGTPR